MNGVLPGKQYSKQGVAGSLIFSFLPIKIVSQINIKLNRVKKHFVFNLTNPTIKIKWLNVNSLNGFNNYIFMKRVIYRDWYSNTQVKRKSTFMNIAVP